MKMLKEISSSNFMKSKVNRALATGVVGVLLTLGLWSISMMETWEAKTWDWRARLLARPGKATSDIVLILLDQNSLDWAKNVNSLTWPWPREMYGAIVDFCQQRGAKAIAMDILFTESSKYGVPDDMALAEAISRFDAVAMAAFFGDQTGELIRWPSTLSPPPINVDGLDVGEKEKGMRVRSFARVSLPVDPLATAAAFLCNVSLRPDDDGIFREAELLGRFDGQAVPSLGLGAYLAANPKTTVSLVSHGLTVGERKIPLDADGRAILRFRGPSGTHKTYSAAAVLQSYIQMQGGEAPNIDDPDAFADKYVFFGFSAPGLYDLRPSPVSGVYPGVEIYATLLDNLLSGDFMRLCPIWMTICLMVLLSFGASLSVSHFKSVTANAGTITLFVAAPIPMALIAYIQGFWLPLVAQETAVIVTIGLTLIVNYTTEGRQKRFIKTAFKHFLSPDVIDQLIAQPERLKLGGERRELSIFFSDLQGFTSISEGMDPESLILLLNDYLTEMTDIIHEEGGTIDKFEGDAIIAFWNAPLEAADHAVRAVRAALRCQERLAQLRPAYAERAGAQVRMRIGIHTGSAVVGNLGSNTRFDYTMIGDAVNLAARLEGANKQFGTFTMISQTTYDRIHPRYPTRELARLAVVGRKEPVTVHEPMLPAAYQEKEKIIDLFLQGLDLFYEGEMARAESIFSEIAEVDPAANAYARMCRELAGAVPDDWRGVWVMKSK